MKIVSAALALIIVALVVVLLNRRSENAELQSTVVALTKDRDQMRDELRTLNSRIAEVQKSAASSVSKSAEAATAKAESAPPAKPEEPVATPGVTNSAPAGWAKNGRNPENYVVGVDTVTTWGGMPSAYVKSVGNAKDSFGGMMQTTAAESYVGKRVRLNAWIKTEDADDGGGHLWLRIDGQERGQMLGFDNMDNRPAKGTTDWQEASVVLDVPAGSSALAYGFFVSGGGKMWVSGQTLQEVGPDVPTTNMLKARSASPKAPRNLGFDPNQPK